MNLLVTGYTGFLGSHVVPRLLENGHTVYGLSRKAGQYSHERLHPIVGDVATTGLGIDEPPQVDAVVHMAALLNLTKQHSKAVWNVNVGGTQNVLDFCAKHKVPHLFFVSTAYTRGANAYELSKRYCEKVVTDHALVHGLRLTIFKPSILIGDTQLQGLPPPGNFYTVAMAVRKGKEWVERSAGLPFLTPSIRIRGNPDGYLNIIPVDIVARHMAELITADREGVFYLTNPLPPHLSEAAAPISEAVGAEIVIVQDFSPNPAEKVVGRLISSLLPYLQGDSFTSSIPPYGFPLGQAFIKKSVELFLKGLSTTVS